MAAHTLKLADISCLSDAELIGTVSRHREESFEELVRRYQRPIAGYVYRMLGDYDAALDVTQEVFIKVFNSLQRYSPEYKFSTWVYRIAHNATIDHLRRNSAHTFSIETESADGAYQVQFECSLPSPERLSERREWRHEIAEAIKKLPPNYRELIILRHANDLSYDEIAEVTKLPLGTVKNRLFRAREAMRELFHERGFVGI